MTNREDLIKEEDLVKEAVGEELNMKVLKEAVEKLKIHTDFDV